MFVVVTSCGEVIEPGKSAVASAAQELVVKLSFHHEEELS
jgi:hypothetical protein